MDLGDQSERLRFLIRDRAGRSTDTFDTVLTDAAITVCKITPRAPRANADADRFVRTVRSEVTDRMLILGEQHPRQALDEYVRHDNGPTPAPGPSIFSRHDPTVHPLR